MQLKVGNKHLNIRKWKGRDKKNFINSLKKSDIDQKEVMNSLVYNNLEEDIALSTDEFKYVLSRIRAISLGEDITIEFYCKDCGKVFKETFKLKDIIRYTFKDISTISVGKELHIKLGNIKNKDYYIKKIQEDADYDFLLRIEEINGNDAFTLEELEEIIDDLDIDVLTDVMHQWEEARFKIDDVNTVTCSCGKAQAYQFDELPGFIPEEWFSPGN